MNKAKERFKLKTYDAILKSAKWLEENADAMVDKFTDEQLGCKSWSITFSFDAERFPEVMIDTDCKMVDVVEGTYLN